MAIAKVNLSVLFVLSMTAGGVRAADWTPIARFPDSGDTLLIDRSSIRAYGTTLQAWVIINYESPRADGARSQRSLLVLNCQTWETATRSWGFYSGKDAKVLIIDSITLRPDELSFLPAPPESAAHYILDFACRSS